jgi:hypothetical protein
VFLHMLEFSLCWLCGVSQNEIACRTKALFGTLLALLVAYTNCLFVCLLGLLVAYTICLFVCLFCLFVICLFAQARMNMICQGGPFYVCVFACLFVCLFVV